MLAGSSLAKKIYDKTFKFERQSIRGFICRNINTKTKQNETRHCFYVASEKSEAWIH